MDKFMDRLYSNTNFYNAVKRGNIEEVQTIYNTAQDRRFGKININWVNDDERYKTPLLIAIEQQNIDMINFLLDKGANLNPRFVSYLSPPPLIYVLNRTDNTISDDVKLEIVKILLNKGANPSIDCETERHYIIQTPLTIAIEQQNIELIKLLLDKGANPNPRYVTIRSPSPLIYILKTKDMTD